MLSVSPCECVTASHDSTSTVSLMSTKKINCLSAEKHLSAVADVTGIVRAMCSRL